MKYLLLILSVSIAFPSCFKDNFPVGSYQYSNPNPTAPVADKVPDSVKIRAAEFKKNTPQIDSLKFFTYPTGDYAIIYYIQDTVTARPDGEIASNKYWDDHLQPFYASSLTYIFKNKPLYYNCSASVFSMLFIAGVRHDYVWQY